MPGLALLGIWYFWPAITAVSLSFYKYRVVVDPEYVGFANFVKLWHDPRFWKALKNSFLFLLGTVPLDVSIPLVLAVLVNQRLRFIQAFRVIYYLPVVTSMVTVAIAWNYLFHQKGVINWILTSLGLLDKPIQYLLDTTWALPALVLVGARKSMGYYMMIYLGGLQSISDDVLEASAIDGATKVQTFMRIIVPLMRPFISICIIVSAMGAMQAFAQIFMMTRGGPLDSTLTLGYYIYQEAFENMNMGYASAVGMVLWVILIIMALVNYRLTRGEEGSA